MYGGTCVFSERIISEEHLPLTRARQRLRSLSAVHLADEIHVRELELVQQIVHSLRVLDELFAPHRQRVRFLLRVLAAQQDPEERRHAGLLRQRANLSWKLGNGGTRTSHLLSRSAASIAVTFFLYLASYSRTFGSQNSLYFCWKLLSRTFFEAERIAEKSNASAASTSILQSFGFSKIRSSIVYSLIPFGIVLIYAESSFSRLRESSIPRRCAASFPPLPT